MARRGEGVRAIARQLGCSRNTVRRYLREERGPPLRAAVAAGDASWTPYKAYLQRAHRAGQAAVDSGDGAAARDRRARLRRRHQPAEGVAGAVEARHRAGSGGALRDAAGPADAGRLHPGAPRPRPADRVRGDDGLQPRHVREVRAAARTRRRCARACARRSTTSAACPSTCCSTTPRRWSSSATPTGEGLHRWNDELQELAEDCGFTPRLCRPYRAKTKGKVERFNALPQGQLRGAAGGEPGGGGLQLDAGRRQRARAPLARRRRQRARARRPPRQCRRCAWPRSRR